MAKEHLTVETLGKLDNGFVGALINHTLAKVAQDIEDRGADLKPRSVVITVEQKRLSDGKVVVAVDVDARVPKLRSHDTLCQLKLRQNDGTKEPEYGLFFQPQNRDNDEQPTLIDAAEEKE